MNIKNSIVLPFTAIALAIAETSPGQAVPSLFPSTFCVHTNEELYLIGQGLTPGERILGFLVSSQYRSPLWVIYPDTNGQVNADITFRNNIYMEGPRAVQVYYFTGQSTNATFHVWYQTYDPTNDWQATITNLDLQPFNYSGSSSNWLQVNIDAAVAPYNNYQVQVATNLSGPWTFIGSPSSSEDSYDWYSEGFQLPARPQMFFRIADPYMPCPCDF